MREQLLHRNRGWPDTGRTWFMAYGLRVCAGEWEARAGQLFPHPAERDYPLAKGSNKHTHILLLFAWGVLSFFF